MSRTLRITALGAATAVALIARTSAPAFAAGRSTATAAPRTLAEIQPAGATKPGARVTSLDTAISKITADTSRSNSDRSAILSTLQGNLTGTGTVAAAIAADTTLAQASTDCRSIFTTYRVYAVALPQAAADRLDAAAVPRLTAAEQKLSAALACKDASKSTPALQGDLADMTQQSISGLAATALAVAPAAFNTNHAALAALK
jgi:hypothetical protein